MTLIEVLVAATLSLMLLGMFFWFLVPAMRYSSQGAARAESQQQALIALNRMEAQLQRSALAGVCFFPQDPLRPGDPVGFTLTPLRDVAPDSRQLWETYLVVFCWDPSSRRLIQKYWQAPGPPGLAITPAQEAPSTLNLAQFKQLAAGVTGNERFLASGVKSFNITDQDAGAPLVPPLILDLTMERETAQSSRPEEFRLTRAIAFRNTW